VGSGIIAQYKRHIGILGGGIIGAATAVELAQRGLKVTVFDAGAAAPQATCGSLGWINAHSPQQEGYFRLRMESIALWRNLLASHPTLPLRFAGTYDWDMPEAQLAPTAASLSALGHRAVLMTRVQLQCEATFLAAPPPAALSLPNEGLAIPTEVAPALRRLAQASGAEFIQTEVQKIVQRNATVTAVLHSNGETKLDGLILASGASTAEILEPLGVKIPMHRSPGMLVTTKPLPFITDKVIAAPGIHFWQHDTGPVLMGADFGGRESSAQTTHCLCERLKDLCALPELPEVHAITITDRPVPEDGLPILDASPVHDNLWFGVMHSGVTLAPVAAKKLSAMVLEQPASNSAAAFKLSRFD